MTVLPVVNYDGVLKQLQMGDSITYSGTSTPKFPIVNYNGVYKELRPGDEIQPTNIIPLSCGDCGVFFNGIDGNNSSIGTSEYINISSASSTTSFSTLVDARYGHGAVSDRLKGICAGGYATGGYYYSTIDYIKFTLVGTNSVDYADLNSQRYCIAGCSNGITGIFIGGLETGSVVVATIESITISSASMNSSFGSINYNDSGSCYWNGACSNNTRALIFTLGCTYVHYLTFSTGGSSTSFGAGSSGGYGASGAADNVRGIWTGGSTNATTATTCYYANIMTTGTTYTFGNYYNSRYHSYATTASNGIRAVFAGGYLYSNYNNMDYVTIQTTGNSTDFGTLSAAEYGMSACSGNK